MTDNGNGLPQLPKGWVWTTLEQLASLSQNGLSKRRSKKGEPTVVLRLADIVDGERVSLDDVRRIKLTENEVEKYELLHNDLLCIRVNGSPNLVGRVIRFRAPSEPMEAITFCDHFIRFRLALPEMAHLLSMYFDTDRARRYVDLNKVSSAGQNTVSQRTMSAITVPLPPLAEQHRIVTKIEELFTQLDAGVAALETAKVQLRRYRQAVLKAAVEGELTREWREVHRGEVEPASALLERMKGELEKTSKPPKSRLLDVSDLPKLPDGWVWTRFEQMLLELRNGYFGGRPASEPPGTPILRISAVRPLSVSFDDLRYLPEVDENKAPRYILRQGDLLFTRYNGNLSLVGACGMVRRVDMPMLYPDKLIRARVPQELVRPDFVEIYFATGVARHFIESRARSTAGQHGIAGQDLKAAPVPLPSLAEQHLIVSEIEQRMSLIDEMEKAIEQNLKRAARLRQSILKRAFEGRLVPQEAEDEPAGALLGRIREERGRGRVEKAARKGPQKKRQPRQLELFEPPQKNSL